MPPRDNENSLTKQVLAALEGRTLQPGDNSMADVAEQLARLVRAGTAIAQKKGPKPVNLDGITKALSGLKLSPTIEIDIASLVKAIENMPVFEPVSYEFIFTKKDGVTSKVVATPIKGN